MKRKFTLLVSLWALVITGVHAQTGDNFNSRPEAALSEVKDYLQGYCWYFPDCDVNQGNWDPGIEGDGAMVSGPGSSATEATGILTPPLDISGNVELSFSYKFSSTFSGSDRRWLRICITNGDYTVLRVLDSIEFKNINTSTVYTYDKILHAGSGVYRIYLNYQGSGGSTRIAIDKFIVSANMRYSGGCNIAPVAVNDNIVGSSNYTATGQILTNDYDGNGDPFTPYIVTNSPDGNVTLNPDNSFSFTPNPDFNGTSTTFTYRICDEGFAPLCSDIATVTINFPANGTLPVSLIDFKGLYGDKGKVDLSWVTTFEENSDHFEVQRSLDGEKWETAGTLAALGNSGVKHTYSFTDDLSRHVVNKKDIYYRLKLVDRSNKATYTKILVIRVYNTHSLKMVSVTPNPAQNDITVNVQLNENSYIVMRMLTADGREVMRKSVEAGAGANSFMLDGTHNMKPGLYYLQVVVNSNERMIVKMIKE